MWGERALQPNRQPRKWESKKLLTVDEETGEVVPGRSYHIPPKIRVGDYVAVMQDAALAVALDREITPTALRVLKFLESKLGYENALPVVQKDIAIVMSLHKQQVSQAFQLLLSKGIIERIECPALKPVYRLNPNYGWRGKHSKWNEEKGKAGPLTLLQGGRKEIADEIAA